MLQAYRMVLTLEKSEGVKDKNAVRVTYGVSKPSDTYGTLSINDLVHTISHLYTAVCGQLK
jgi:hypothetical protein